MNWYKKSIGRGRFAATVMAATMLLCACDAIVYDIPTEVSTSDAEVYEDQVFMDVETASVGQEKIAQISQDYWGHGNTPLLVTVIYDPASRSSTAAKAAEDAARIGGLLRKSGVQNVETDVMPVQAAGDVSRTLISYDTLQARPPSDCKEAISMDFVDTEKGDDYKLGCSVETYLARQVARPKDLLGNGDMANSDGRRTSNVLEPYRTGTPNPALTGETASGN